MVKYKVVTFTLVSGESDTEVEAATARLTAAIAAALAPPPVVAPVVPLVTGTIVPLYTRPDHPSWAALIAAKLAHPTVPVIAIVNPASGPGVSVSTSYSAGILKLQDAGIKVIGYVPTGYASRPADVVALSIGTWKKFYPSIDGIFFDEMSNVVGKEDYYWQLSAVVGAAGMSLTVGNPGTDTKPSFVGSVNVIVVYEKAGARPLPEWYAAHPRTNFAVIPHSVPALDVAYVRAAKRLVGFVYMTNDALANPWDSLPPYFDALLAELETQLVA